jgi:hypothetical protein
MTGSFMLQPFYYQETRRWYPLDWIGCKATCKCNKTWMEQEHTLPKHEHKVPSEFVIKSMLIGHKQNLLCMYDGVFISTSSPSNPNWTAMLPHKFVHCPNKIIKRDKLLYSSWSKSMSCVISQHIKSVFIIFKSVPWHREFPWALRTNNNHLPTDWHCM